MMRVRLSFTGDILAYRSFVRRSKNGSFSSSLKRIAPLLHSSDYVIGNLEMPLAGESVGYTKMDMLFNAPDCFAIDLKDAGFDMLTTANNHCLDKGITGLFRTADILDQIGIDHTGTFRSIKDKHYFVKTIGNLKIGIVSCTYGTNPNVNGILIDDSNSYIVNLVKAPDLPYKRPIIKQWLLDRVIYNLPLRIQNRVHPIYPNHPYEDCVDALEINYTKNLSYLNRMDGIIREARQEADILILCLHAGGQFNSKIGDYTCYLHDHFLKSPVDLIVTNHPHCVLEARWVSNKFLACSLGNFLFTPFEGYYIDGVYADYGIVLHVDLDPIGKQVDKVSFSIIKNVLNQGYPQVVPVYELYQELESVEEKEQLSGDISAVINRFLGKRGSRYDIRKEYDFREMKVCHSSSDYLI